MLKAVFQEGITDEDIEILVFLIHHDFSQRALANLISECFGTSWAAVYNIVLGVGTNKDERNLKRLEEIRTGLLINGYEGDLYAN